MASVIVRVDQPFGTINPLLYGHFAEHLGTCIYEGLWVGEDSSIPNTAGFRNDVVGFLKRVKPAVIRWPGGCFADTYHWRDGIGPREQRPRRVNVWWGQTIEPNQVGTHEFLRLCRLVGAAPYLCGNLGSGSPGELADWVEYCNFTGDSTLAAERAAHGSPDPLNVTFWGVGNENWGCGGNLDPEDYAVEYRRFATYLHEFSGWPLYLIACGPNGNQVDWTHRFLNKLGSRRKIHGFAAHYYCGTAGTATDFTAEQCHALVRRATVNMERLIVQQRAALDSYDPERRIGLIIDEWGTWHPADPARPNRSLWQQNTMRDALVAAGTLDIFNRHANEVVMANIAQTVNVLQALCLTDGDRMCVTPTGYVYELYAGHQDQRVVPCDIAGEAIAFSEDGKTHRLVQLDGSASYHDKDLLVTLTHRRLDGPEEVILELRGASAAAATARVLAAAEVRAHNTFEDPDRVRPRALPVTVAGGTVRAVLPAASVAAISIRMG